MTIAEQIENLKVGEGIGFSDEDGTNYEVYRKENGFTIYDDATSLDDLLLLDDGLCLEDTLNWIYDEGDFQAEVKVCQES